MSPETPQYAPVGWEARTIRVQVDRYSALCMEPHDLVIAKLGAGREKDLEFARAVVAIDIVRRDELLARVSAVAAPDAHRELIRSRVRALYAMRA